MADFFSLLTKVSSVQYFELGAFSYGNDDSFERGLETMIETSQILFDFLGKTLCLGLKVPLAFLLSRQGYVHSAEASDLITFLRASADLLPADFEEDLKDRELLIPTGYFLVRGRFAQSHPIYEHKHYDDPIDPYIFFAKFWR